MYLVRCLTQTFFGANIADLPSRGSHDIPKALGSVEISLHVPTRRQLERPAVQWYDDAHRVGGERMWPGVTVCVSSGRGDTASLP